MVDIKLISFKNGIAIIECYPDGKQENMFKLTIDVENQKIMQHSLGKTGDAYAIHAAWKMFHTYIETGVLPENATSIWC